MNRPDWAGQVVLDTNVVLDLLVFDDPSTQPLKAALTAGALVWLATPAMRDELQRVLTYPQIAARLQVRNRSGAAVLAWFDRFSQPHAPGAACPVACADKDDQMFVDLAFARRADLLSKDHAVLRLRKRLAPHGVLVQAPGAAARATVVMSAGRV